MKKFVKNKLKDQKGMTLIELLAVIVIIAIIAAIAIPAIGNIIENSRHGAVKADFQNAIAAANLYITEGGDVPADIDDINTYLDDAGSLDLLAITQDADGTILISGSATAPNDDAYSIGDPISNSALSELSNEEFGAAYGPDGTGINPTTP